MKMRDLIILVPFLTGAILSCNTGTKKTESLIVENPCGIARVFDFSMDKKQVDSIISNNNSDMCFVPLVVINWDTPGFIANPLALTVSNKYNNTFNGITIAPKASALAPRDMILLSQVISIDTLGDFLNYSEDYITDRYTTRGDYEKYDNLDHLQFIAVLATQNGLKDVLGYQITAYYNDNGTMNASKLQLNTNPAPPGEGVFDWGGDTSRVIRH